MMITYPYRFLLNTLTNATPGDTYSKRCQLHKLHLVMQFLCFEMLTTNNFFFILCYNIVHSNDSTAAGRNKHGYEAQRIRHLRMDSV